MDDVNVFQAEAALFSHMWREWATTHHNRWVVLDGSDVVGFYDDVELAWEGGAAALKRPEFFVRRVAEPKVHTLPTSVRLAHTW